MDYKELLMQCLTKFYNKTEQEVNELIHDGENVSEKAFDNLSTLDAARVKKFKDQESQAFKNGEAKTVERVNKAAANAVKEALGIDTDSDVLSEVLDTGKTQIAEKTKKKVEPLTDEAVKQHPLYIKLEKERVPKQMYDELNEKHTKTIQEHENEKTFSVIDEQAMVHLKKMNPNFEMYKDSPAVLSNLEKMFKNSLREYEYKPDGNGGYIVLKNGERVNDAHGNPETIDNIVKKKAPEFFTFLKQPAKGGAGNDQKEPGSATIVDGKPSFKTRKEYSDYMAKFTGNTPEEMAKRVEALNIFKQAVESKQITE